MHGRRSSQRIGIDLSGIIEFQRTKDTMECIIHNINEECTGVMVIASDPRICAKEDVNLNIFLPAERSPVKCTGRIVWYSSADKELLEDGVGYAAGISITGTSRLDRRRLELVVAQRKAYFGEGLSFQNL